MSEKRGDFEMAKNENKQRDAAQQKNAQPAQQKNPQPAQNRSDEKNCN